MTAKLPPSAKPYKQTPVFTEASVPGALLGEHSTKEGVWGLIHVEEGTLHYLVTDPRRAQTERILTPDSEPGVVEPTIIHRVKPVGAVRFYVEFWREDPVADG